MKLERACSWTNRLRFYHLTAVVSEPRGEIMKTQWRAPSPTRARVTKTHHFVRQILIQHALCSGNITEDNTIDAHSF